MRCCLVLLGLGLVGLVGLGGCVQGPAGTACARHSDCASHVCRADGTCSTVVDAGIDAEVDAYATNIPPYTADAPSD
jgi:hypothetical protein